MMYLAHDAEWAEQGGATDECAGQCGAKNRSGRHHRRRAGAFDGSTVALVRQALAAVIDESSADVTIDLGATGSTCRPWPSSPTRTVDCAPENRRLVVCASSDRVRRVLAVTGLSRVIAVQAHTRHMVA
jgi:anti-anti-sigma regulatory factor